MRNRHVPTTLLEKENINSAEALTNSPILLLCPCQRQTLWGIQRLAPPCTCSYVYYKRMRL